MVAKGSASERRAAWQARHQKEGGKEKGGGTSTYMCPDVLVNNARPLYVCAKVLVYKARPYMNPDICVLKY